MLKFVYKVALLPRERGQVDSALNELIDEAEILFDFDPSGGSGGSRAARTQPFMSSRPPGTTRSG
jgi:hypothetical protein